MVTRKAKVWPGMAAWCHLAAAFARLCCTEARAQQDAWPPPMHIGSAAIRPYGLLQLDSGTTFAQDAPGPPSAGFNLRRARLGFDGSVGQAVEFAFNWDFGGAPGSRGGLNEASVSFRAFQPFVLTAGVFKPSFSLIQSGSVSHLLFLERPAATEIASDLAGGAGRVGIELRASGERYFASAALTGGRTGPGSDSSERGGVVRAAALPVRTAAITMHVGASAGMSWRPPRGEEGQRATALSDRGEVLLGRRDTIDTGSIAARSAWAAGPELALAWDRLLLQGEWYRVVVQTDAAASQSFNFSGWYAQAAWTVLGEPRRYRSDRAAFGAPGGEGSFDPTSGQWGAIELGLRYSTMDLNDGEIRGGKQDIWALGVGWWLRDRVAILGQWQHERFFGAEGGDRRAQLLGMRLTVGF